MLACMSVSQSLCMSQCVRTGAREKDPGDIVAVGRACLPMCACVSVCLSVSLCVSVSVCVESATSRLKSV